MTTYPGSPRWDGQEWGIVTVLKKAWLQFIIFHVCVVFVCRKWQWRWVVLWLRVIPTWFSVRLSNYASHRETWPHCRKVAGSMMRYVLLFQFYFFTFAIWWNSPTQLLLQQWRMLVMSCCLYNFIIFLHNASASVCGVEAFIVSNENAERIKSYLSLYEQCVKISVCGVSLFGIPDKFCLVVVVATAPSHHGNRACCEIRLIQLWCSVLCEHSSYYTAYTLLCCWQ